MEWVTEEVRLALYRSMVRIRLFEERIADLYPEQEMRCPVHLCIGEEAIPAGVGLVVRQDDMAFSNHRSHGHYLGKGGNMQAMLAEIYGKADGCSRGRGGSMHLVDHQVNFLASTSIVGGTIPLAAGAAFAAQLDKKGCIAISFFGDAALEEGVIHETFNFAALKKLPILFICENNLYSVMTPLRERQPKRDLCDIPKAHGIATWHGDGNDAEEVYRIASEAVAHARAKGPAFCEFMTYRWREHCGPNPDHTKGYRPAEEVNAWETRCPIKKLSESLEKDGKKKELVEIGLQVKKEIDLAVDFAKSSPFPKKGELDKYVYA